MGIAVYDILQLSIFNKFNLIAGNQGLTNRVRNVNVLDYEFDLAKKSERTRCHFDKDSFVVSSMLFAKDDPGEILNAVRYLIEDQASGLAIKNIYYSDLSKDVTNLADREGFPIFIFDASVGPIEKIVTLINDRIRESESLEIKEAKLRQLFDRRMDPVAVKAVALDLNARFQNYCCGIYLKPRQFFAGVHLQYQIEWARNHLPKYCDIFTFQEGLILILTSDQPFNESSVNKQAARYLYECGIEQEQFYVALSMPHEHLSELDSCICESIYAMEYCELTGNSWSTFSDLGIYQIIFPHLYDCWFFDYCQRIINPILEYDQKYNSELMETARAFIHCQGNVGQASTQLLMHKNSIRYRLGKIRDICGFNCENRDFYEELALAVKLHDIYRKSNRS